jgi:hypothetical protein
MEGSSGFDPSSFHIPPPHDPEFYKAEAAYRTSQARGGLELMLLELLWRLAKGTVLILSLPVRLPFSWWLRQRRKRQEGRPPYLPSSR